MLERAREATEDLRLQQEAERRRREHLEILRPAVIINNPQVLINITRPSWSAPAIAPTSNDIDANVGGTGSSVSAGLATSVANAINMEYCCNAILLSGAETTLERHAKVRCSLRKWATQHQITHKALKDILTVINRDIEKMLPEDPRTLLETPQEVCLTNIGTDGQYWHHGLEKSLRSLFRNIDESKTIAININMDGLPIYNSSKVEFWPILFNIADLPHIPAMVIGIYCGTSKCTDLQSYLTPFMDELKETMENGIFINSHRLTVQLRCFICDSPARAYVKGVANFNGQFGCQKCTTVGEYSYISNSNVFPRTECEKRTDSKFRRRMYGEHHKIDSPLLALDIDIVEQFIVADSLHLLHLGVMKRLLFGWRDGTFRQSDTKWRAQTTFEVSEYLKNKCRMPAEFHRKMCGLDCLSHWKGTEYRTFLHYVGIVVLKDHLTHDAYEHFLLLFCAVTICSSKQYFKLLSVAHNMLLQFIEIFAEVYGKHHINSNVHNLSHIVDEVKRFGELESISAYPFKNQLGRMERLLRNGNRPLAQVAKRMIEDWKCSLHSNRTYTVEKKYMVLSKRNDGSNVPDALKSSIDSFHSKIDLKDFSIGTDPVNCWILTKKNEIACVTNIIYSSTHRHVQLCCVTIDEKYNFFIIPIESRHFNIYCARRGELLNKTQKLFALNNVKCKLVRLPNRDIDVFLPLLHTNNCTSDSVPDSDDEE